MSLDLSQRSDLDLLRVISNERPEFVQIVVNQMDAGRTDEEIVRITCEAGGSPQAMRWTKAVCRALRSLPA